MTIPFTYTVRSLVQRKTSTLLTVSAFGLVLFALIALLAMVEGIEATLISTGSPDRFFVIHERATTENQSRLRPADVLRLGSYAGIKLDAAATPLLSPEAVKTTPGIGAQGIPVQINMRGVELDKALAVHDRLRLTSGRFFNEVTDGEVVVGKSIAEGLGVVVGSTFRTPERPWAVVGLFEDAGSPFEAEVWTSRADMALAFNRPTPTSVWALAEDPGRAAELVARLNTDPALEVLAMREQAYFAQGAAAALGLQVLAWFIAAVMAAGAVFSAMNTMYASLADRARELATLRALGFEAPMVLHATVREAVLMALLGGVLACLAALTLDGTVLRTPVPGLGPVSFAFDVTLWLLVLTMGFAFALGIAGGWVPASRAVRTPLVEALNR